MSDDGPRPASGSAAAGLVGRERETGALRALLGPGPDTTLVLVGDPGIGKTALVAHAVELAVEAGFEVLMATGVEAETELPFSGLHQLLGPMLDAAEGLAPRPRAALLSAVGLSDAGVADPYLVALAAVDVVAATTARGRSVVLVVDDAQWLDPPSLDALAVLLRRAPTHGYRVLVATRPDSGAFWRSGAPELRVGGLDALDAATILRAHPRRLSARSQHAVLDQARGNPLALWELPTTWAEERGRHGNDPVGLSTRLERAFAARIGSMPTPTRELLLVAALCTSEDADEIITAALALGVGADAVNPAAAAGLLEGVEGRHRTLRFRHPLVRSAVVAGATLQQRQRAHAALAATLDEPHRRIRHLATSTDGPDDAVADALEDSVSVLLRRGGLRTAIADLERAAALTSDPARRGRRLLTAAEQAFALGEADTVDRLVHAADRLPLPPLDRARRRWLAEIFDDGVPGDAVRVRELAATAVVARTEGELGLALDLLLGAALRCFWADAGDEARMQVVAVAEEIGPDAADDPRRLAVLAVAAPVERGTEVVEALTEPGIDAVTDADALRLYGMAAHAVGDQERAADLLGRAATLLREQGRLGLLPQVLSMRVPVGLELGEWREAAEAAVEARSLAEETGQPIWDIGTVSCDARAAALRGETDRALTMAAEVELAAAPRRLSCHLACADLARGIAWLGAGRAAEAFTALQRVVEPGRPSFHPRERFGAVMFLAEAAREAGHLVEARDTLAALEHVAAQTTSPLLAAQMAYARAVLADDHDADALFAVARRRDLTRWPWIRARLELAHGALLARRGDADRARPLLREARTTLARMGAAPWAELARLELRALSRSTAPSSDSRQRPRPPRTLGT